MQRGQILLILAILTAVPAGASDGPDLVPAGGGGRALPAPADATPRLLPEAPTAAPTPAPPAQARETIDEVLEVLRPVPARIITLQPDAVEVFRSSFEDSVDTDLDGWPDGWVRKRGPGYPWYLKIGMRYEPAAEGQQALRIELDGGAGAAYSPPVPVRSQFSYLFEGHLKTAGLQHNEAYYSVTFYDADGTSVQQFMSERLTHAADWTRLTIGPMTITSPKVDHAIIGVHLMPGAKADLTGSASFDQIVLGRLPNMTLSTNRPHNIYTDANELEVTCRVSGIFEQDPNVEFELIDIDGRKVRQHSQALSILATESRAGTGLPLEENLGFQDATSWKPQLDKPGFYRIRCRLRCRGAVSLEREQTLVLLDPAETPPRGEFGWTLPNGDHPLSLSALERILPQMGINWVKLPLWVNATDTRRLDQLIAFSERMSQRGIETVGILSDPPPEARTQIGDTPTLQAADIFTTDPELWYPLLEPVMARLSLQVRWWQLGLDDDVSFVGYPNLSATIARIRAALQRFGQEVNLGIGWRFLDQQNSALSPPWNFLTLTGNPQLTDEEIASYLPAFDRRRAQRWISIEPLSCKSYSMETRASDLVHRMLAAKMAGAEGIFMTNPFAEPCGLLKSDGTPGELLLPWRMTALVLAGSQYLGTITLPGGSHNYVFERDGKMMMVIWNQSPTRESINLGDHIQVADVWGRHTTPTREGENSQLEIGPLPSFVTGINPAILRWNMAVQFERSAVPSVFGIAHENGLMVRNTFRQGVGVKVRLNLPESWKVTPRVLDFKMATGEDTLQPFGIALPYDASSGREPVRIDFEVNAEQRHRFSVYRHLDVGDGDITLDVTTRLNDRGELEVEQIVTNHTDRVVSFKCFLYIPDRRRLMTQVIELTHDRDRKRYRLPDGVELLGQTLWLRAEEINGNRTLNCRFTAEK